MDLIKFFKLDLFILLLALFLQTILFALIDMYYFIYYLNAHISLSNLFKSLFTYLSRFPLNFFLNLLFFKLRLRKGHYSRVVIIIAFLLKNAWFD